MRSMMRLTAVILAIFLSGCAADRLLVSAGQIALPKPEVAVSASVDDVASDQEMEAPRPTIDRLKMPERVVTTPSQNDLSARFPSDNKLTASAADLPVRDFLAYVFGELLKVNYIVADGSVGLDKPVTLNTTQPISSRQLYKLTADLLSQNGLSIIERDAVLFVGPADGKAGGDLLIGYGAKPENVPDVPGRILQIVPLKYGYNASIERTINQLVDVTVAEDVKQGAVFITGSRIAILKALDIVRLFDQPSVRSSRVGVINLTYTGAREFIDQVSPLLENEGIPVGQGRGDDKVAVFVPLDRLGAVAVFASSIEILDRVEFWTKQVDRPSQGPSLRYFIYQPRNARAADLAESLAPLIGGAVPGVQVGNQSRDTRSAMGTTAGTNNITSANALRRDGGAAATGAPAPMAVAGEGVTMSVDPRSNSVVFFTTGLRYEALLPLIRRLDIPPKQILLEATIAEVSLTGEFANGVEFAFRDGKLSGGTLGRLGTPSGGLALNFIESVTDQAVLRLQASDSRVNIISKPVLVVRDGVSATIAVGNDVPTVGATASDPIQSNRQITTVLYRKTGLNLAITPTINAQGVVVMQIAQTISNSVPGSSGVSGAPIFFERSVSTEVVARSGQTVLLAGLISESGSDSSEGIPWARKLPLVGPVFRSDSRKQEKTELVLLITPRVIDTPEEWDVVKNNLNSALKLLQPVAPDAASQSGSDK
jgi:general secretion pathway protein D